MVFSKWGSCCAHLSRASSTLGEIFGLYNRFSFGRQVPSVVDRCRSLSSGFSPRKPCLLALLLKASPPREPQPSPLTSVDQPDLLALPGLREPALASCAGSSVLWPASLFLPYSLESLWKSGSHMLALASLTGKPLSTVRQNACLRLAACLLPRPFRSGGYYQMRFQDPPVLLCS